MDLGLNGRRAAVAAASSGLGLAVARTLAEEGARVAMCSRDRARIDAAAATVAGDPVAIVADVAAEDGATGFVRDAVEAFGGVDVLVTNAGGPPPGTFASTELTAYQQALDLNFRSAVAMCRAAVPSMQERGWGRVVAITSSVVREPSPVLVASVAARTAVTGFLKVLAGEVASSGITVNSVQPGLHDTPRLRGLGRDPGELVASIPVRKLGDPADFGAVVAFLCSEQARFVTGTSVLVDGGASSSLM